MNERLFLRDLKEHTQAIMGRNLSPKNTTSEKDSVSPNSNSPAIQKIVHALMKRKRGRPKKRDNQENDTKRAWIVLYFWVLYPKRFQNRRKVIEHLTGVASITNKMKKEGRFPFDSSGHDLFLNCATASIEESVSRGFRADDTLKVVEKIVKNTADFSTSERPIGLSYRIHINCGDSYARKIPNRP